MTKQEHIDYWLLTADRNWNTVRNLMKSKDYVSSLFFAHLHLEKICKALWVKNNKGNTPPKVHHLVKILTEANVKFSNDQLDFLLVMNTFQLEGRYPDYKDKLFKNYKKKNTEEILNQVLIFSQWLREKL